MKRLLYLLLVLLPLASLGQATITGHTQVTAGARDTFYVNFPYYSPSTRVSWNVSGGTVIASDHSLCIVQWNSVYGSGSINVYEDLYGQYGELLLQINTGMPAIYPYKQEVIYGTTPASIQIGFEYPPVGSTTYQWQQISGGFWVNIAGQTTPVYWPPPVVTDLTRYRCVVNCNGTIYNLEAQLVITESTAGMIYHSGVVPYNTPLTGVLTKPGASSNCAALDYTWELAVEDGPWMVVGTGEAYTATTPIIGKTRIRRKAACWGQVLYTDTLEIIPQYAPVDWDNKNYVREITVLKPGIVTWQQADHLPIGEKFQTTTYLDEAGRTIQINNRGVSSTDGTTWNDVIKPFAYGKITEDKDYLPYVSIQTPGHFKQNAITEQQGYIRSFFNEPATAPTYNLTQTDDNPTSRSLKQQAPGDSWGGSGRGTEQKMYFNTNTDAVRIWNLVYTGNDFSSYGSDNTYPVNALSKTITIDEKGKQVIEFTDQEGSVVLKKVQLTAAGDDGNGASHTGWLCTYYVYDDLGRLRAIITPKAVEQLAAGNWQLTDELLVEQCFRYEYDARGRLIKKKVPGAAPLYMVYDNKDRLVFSQDGNLRQQKQWTSTLYDVLDRPIMTGLITYEGNLSDLQQAVIAKNTASAPPVDMVEGMQVNKNPLPDGAPFILLTQSHYDVYDGLPAPLSSSLKTTAITDQHFITSYNTAPSYAQPLTQSTATLGMVTWTKTRVLGTADFIATVYLYDEKGRLIQAQAQNETKGVDVVTTQFDFAGRVLRSHQQHQKGNATPIEIADKPTFDKIGRLLTIEKNIDKKGWKKLAQYEYNALGQVKKKILAPAYNNNAGIQQLDYAYNIQGWLLGVNRAYLKDKGGSDYTDRYFGFELGYDKTVTTPGAGSGSAYQYNGTIATAVWKSKGDGVRRKYNLFYDDAGRFAQADFTQATTPEAGATWNTAGANFSVHGFAADNNKLQYDANGNLQTLVQHGIKGMTPDATLDALRYTYFSGTNKLQKVVDEANTELSKLGDFTYQPKDKSAVDYADYGYDANGNLVTDKNKASGTSTGKEVSGGGIVYNHLSLPTLIANDKGTIAYTYDADGNKLKKVFTENGTGKVTTTLYMGGFVYVNDVLQFVSHEEGRARYRVSDGGYVYDYFLKDQLGNTRMVLTEEERTDAYPVASMETAPATTEEALYSNLNTTRVDKPAGYPTDTYTTPNDKVARVRGDGQKIGPALLLKVMAGDQFNLRVNSWYKTGGTAPNSPVSPLTDLVSALSNSIGAVSGKVTAVELSSSGVLSPEVLGFFNSQPVVSGKPKAYVNWLLLDEQFHYVSSSSSAEPVGGDQVFTTHIRNNLPIEKSGYLYVYVSNETPNIDVYFDNLQVSHIRGPLLEEIHYYPYGGVMKGISSKAAGSIANLYQYQGDYSDYEEETRYHDFALRNYDPQLGRWLQQDPYDEFASLYVGMGGDPINNVDPDGGSIGPLLDLGTNFLNAAGNTVLTAAAGYGIGYLVGGKEGAKWGAAIGFGVSAGRYVPWDKVGGALENAGQWAGSNVGGLFSSDDWYNLTKNALAYLADQYSNRIFASEGERQNYIGNMFENNWHTWAQMHFTQNGYHSNREPDELDDGQGLSIPSHSSRKRVIVDAKMTEYDISNEGTRTFADAHWFEVKAVNKNVSLSTNNYQIQYEMDALAYYHSDAAKLGVASYSVVTTGNAVIGNSVYSHGYKKGLYVRHFKPQYKVTSNGIQVRFGWEQSTRVKGVPIRMFTSYTYGLPVNMSF